jgi:hypothetical protein
LVKALTTTLPIACIFNDTIKRKKKCIAIPSVCGLATVPKVISEFELAGRSTQIKALPFAEMMAY